MDGDTMLQNDVAPGSAAGSDATWVSAAGDAASAVRESSTPFAPLIVVMGVSGAGKTVIGRQLAGALGVRFADGDDLHPPENVRKMSEGRPLTDDDRWPWLAGVGAELAGAQGTGLVIACSALKRAYRRAILARQPHTDFIHLTAPHDVLAGRLADRRGHFMPPSLLDSQWAALEPLADDEPGFAVDVTPGPDDVVAEILKLVGANALSQ